jgi:hypothetical protein
MALTTIPSGMIAPAQTLSLNGVTFPATAVPSADANTLDDYEEGTWTPTDVSGAGLTFTQAAQARYIKVGRLVFINIYIAFPVTSNTASVRIGGLPFTAGDGYYYPTGRCSYSGGGRLVLQVNEGSTNSFLYEEANGLPGNNNLSNGFLIMSGSYMAAA